MPKRLSWFDDVPEKKPKDVMIPLDPLDEVARPIPRKMPPLPRGAVPSETPISVPKAVPKSESQPKVEPTPMAPAATATRPRNIPPVVDPREDADEERENEDDNEGGSDTDEFSTSAGRNEADDNDNDEARADADSRAAAAAEDAAESGDDGENNGGTPTNGSNGTNGASASASALPRRPPPNGILPSEEGEPVTVAKINGLIQSHKSDDQAYIAVTRIKPQSINNVDATGWTMRVNMDTIENADDIIEKITRYTGGLLYELRFYGNKPVRGKNDKAYGYVGIARLKINAPPKLPTEQVDGVQGVAGLPSGGTSDAMAMATHKLLAGMVKDFQEKKGVGADNSTEVMKMVKEIVESQTGPLIEGHKSTIDFQRREIEQLRAKMEDVLTKPATDPNMVQWMAQKSSDSVVQVSKDMQAERERWQSERTALITAHEKDRLAITDRMQAQIDKLTEKLEEANVKVREAIDRANTERTTREASFEDRIRHKEEMHQRDVESWRRDKENEVKRVSDQLSSDVKRLSDQLSDERRVSDKQREAHEGNLRQQRENYELNTKTQLEKQEGILRERIEGLNNQIKLLEQRTLDQEKRYEDKVRDLEKQRDNAQNQLLAEKTAPKPDALQTTMAMMGSVRDVAGLMGLKKEEHEAPPENEMVALMRGAKDAGIVDGVKGIIGQVASAVASRAATVPAPQPQQPQVVMQTVPVYPGHPQYQQPLQPQYVPQQQFVPMQPAGIPQPQQHVHQAVPTPQQQPPMSPQQMAQQAQQSQQQAQPQQVVQQQAVQRPVQQQQPQEISAAEVGIWKMIIADFESSYDSGMKAEDMSKKILEQLPRAALRGVIDSGVGQFDQLVKVILAQRPEKPDSDLLSPSGNGWLREVFAITAKALSTST